LLLSVVALASFGFTHDHRWVTTVLLVVALAMNIVNACVRERQPAADEEQPLSAIRRC